MSLDIESVVDRDALTSWLDTHAPQLGAGSLEVHFLHGGTSNIILTIDRGGVPAVLRRAPSNPPPNSERMIAREARLLNALNGTPVPHPHLHGYCNDSTVIGTPFYVMEKVDGWAPEVTSTGCKYPTAFDNADARRDIGFAAIDALSDLAVVDHRAIGLADFGQPGDFLSRQVDRWLGQLRSYPERYPKYSQRELPGLAAVTTWLRENLPAKRHEGIVHGDYGPPNILFAPARPVRVHAIIDWELATIGDPQLDLALFLCNLRDDAAPAIRPAAAYFDPTDFPTRQELIARYAQRTARDVSDFLYYLVLAQFRMACILEYKVAENAGQSMVGHMAIFPDMVLNLMTQAYAMIKHQ
jgi:aminoglycoside phosphotransferase (APT) family kinase protein